MNSAINCVLCNVDDTKKIMSKEGAAIVKCKRCGLIYVNPRLSNEEIKERYEKDTYMNSQYYEKSIQKDITTFHRRIKDIERFTPERTILDFGSSVGTFLHVAKLRGWKGTGIEINKASAELSRKKFGVEVHTDDAEIKDKKFDVIHLGDVIEHVEDPKEMVHDLKRNLKKGGLLVMSTPDFDSRVARMFQVKPTEHLFYFTKATMRKMLDQEGFTVQLCKNIARERDVRSLMLSSTFNRSPVKLVLMKFLTVTGLSIIVEKIISSFKDDMIVIAKKS